MSLRNPGPLSRLLPLAALLALLLALLSTVTRAAPAEPGSFALIGDVPYNSGEEIAFERMREDIDADRDVGLVVHVGDLKGSGEPCSDELLAARVAQIAAFAKPVLITPGDNEWTDCHLRRAGRHLPTERLAHLRALLYPDPHASLGRAPLARLSQADDPAWSEFVEHGTSLWNGLLLTSLHVVGSDNGREPWRGIDPADTLRAERLAEVQRRERAVAAWVATAFAHARAGNAQGLVLFMQANPRTEWPAGSPRRSSYEALMAQIEREARAWGRPVLLAHGDLHEFFHDQPVPGLPTLQRVQSFGSPAVHWVEVIFDPTARPAFRFRPHHVHAPGQS
ncbi:MAG: hypothetical protein RL669_1580 [Pseudomonadota bacterium]|jgi:hypothetical protein